LYAEHLEPMGMENTKLTKKVDVYIGKLTPIVESSVGAGACATVVGVSAIAINKKELSKQ